MNYEWVGLRCHFILYFINNTDSNIDYIVSNDWIVNNELEMWKEVVMT
jgi:hypothetical protein